MKRVSLMILCIGLLSMIESKAQDNDTLSFSLQQALDYATEHAFMSKSASYDIEAAEKKVWEYLAIGLPQVDVSGQLTNNLKIQENFIKMEVPDEEPMYMKVQFGQQYNWNLSGNVNQLLFDGSYILGVRASQVYVDLSKKQKTKTQIDVREAVAQAYYIALVSLKNLETFRRNLAVNEQTLKETDAYYKNGFREMTDVDQLRLMVNNSKNLVLEAERQLLVAEAVLKYSMGLSIDQAIALSDNIDVLLTPVEAIQEVRIDFDVRSHIDYSLMETQEEAQKLILKNEKAAYLPKLNAFYNYGYFEFGDSFKDMNNSNSSMLGVSLNLPIFSSGMRRSKVQQEKINYLKLKNDMNMLEEGLKQELLVAQSNFKNAQESYLYDKEGEEIAFRIYDRTRVKFGSGLASSTELSQNEGQYIQSQISFIQSTLNLLDTHIKYLKAINRL